MQSKSEHVAKKTRPGPYSASNSAKKLVETNKLKTFVVPCNMI